MLRVFSCYYWPMTKTVSSIKELRTVAKGFLSVLAKSPESSRAVLVGLSGDLGAGKTAFTKCVAEVLGIADTVTSPTFVLEKRYDIPHGSLVGGRFTKLIHVDAYRLYKGEEMKALDWEGTLADGHNLILLEWPEQVSEALPKNTLQISFEYVDDSVRRVSGDYIK